MLSSTLYAGLLCSLAAPAFGIAHEKLAAVPNGWTLIKDAPETDTITLSIALARQNLDQLESKLTTLATPGNAEYGQWLDKADIESLFPTASDEAIIEWLKAAGITQVSRQGSLVNFASTVGTVNKLFNTTFSYYQNGASQKLRTTEYSIPDSLTDAIDLVAPTVFFGKDQDNALPSFASKLPTLPKRASNSSSCADLITPACLAEMYNLGDYKPVVSSGSRIGFGSFLNESANYADLAAYEKLFKIPSQNFSVELINGGTNDQNWNTAQLGEADLDVELIVAVSHPLPVVEYITGGSPPYVPNADGPTAADNQNEPYLEYYEYLLSKPNAALPQVISNSYGDDEQTVPKYYAKRVCNMIGLMGLRGITVLESSGDTGIGSACMSNDGTNTPQFTPTFPGTCPFITSVGGTQAYAPEVAWDGSSGGFSNYFKRPRYQEAAVKSYLKHHISKDTKEYYSQYTNFHGRGFPDVSAHSLTPDYEVINYGARSRSGGTSAACPVFAGIVGMLNDARLRAGKPTLGFLNPLLYSEGFKTFTDITAGASVGCDGTNPQSGKPVPGGGIIPYAHWNATAGWDPVTGLGVPNFLKLKELVLSF
ncbi:S53 family peptidase [Aspergillus clavatus NRRL 1]|uniref:tripeptidyl-peptidase II n=1 Tax=Aspergillus clavatus (strain ATCC 1007 / CBS 513.65 / DSM 816 / NCTC 3887 / NRRL 1 / QM 1276 / 107) TaxID=344612 RepID=A1CIX0_ASPCL|nr:tripeptidyl peptidase A [Aspergillus clavatus NRRL 1]EAW10825.1 tripeptidyl peptidase A [Aspergillus clavatus NRRL 1]